MQLEGRSEEGAQQSVSALSFVYFCHAIFESEHSKKEDFLKLFEQWLMVQRESGSRWRMVPFSAHRDLPHLYPGRALRDVQEVFPGLNFEGCHVL